tara:strand:+ start:30884 stop:31018 length:135 start_codon:yes stop_codon:yes gene_type:complete
MELKILSKNVEKMDSVSIILSLIFGANKDKKYPHYRNLIANIII